MHTPGTQITSIFEGEPPKTRPKFQSKQGSFGFQVYIYIIYHISGQISSATSHGSLTPNGGEK